jgi:selenocysteine lyase/cysteine desulfurase
VRISAHFYNDEREIELCVEALAAFRDRILA